MNIKSIFQSRLPFVLVGIMLITFCNTKKLNAQNVMSLQQCIAYAIEHKANLKSVAYDEQIQAARNNQIGSAIYPQVSFSGGLQGFPVVPKSRSRADLFSFGNLYAPIDSSVVNYQAIAAANANRPEYQVLQFALPYSGSCTLSVAQILFNSEIFVALQARQTISDLMKLNTKRTEEQLRVDVSKAYYNCLIASERIKLLDENIELLGTLEKNMRSLYKEGFVEKIDADKLLVQLNNLSVEKQKIDNLVQLGYNLLKFQIGMPMQENLRLTDKLDAAALNADMMADIDYNKRIEMQLMKTSKKLTEYDLIRTEKSYLPTVVAIGSLGAATGSKRIHELFTLPWYAQSLVGVQASMGLFDGGKRKYTIQEKKLQLQKSETDMEMFRSAVDLESASARTNLANNLRSLQNQKSNIELAQKVFDIAKKKQKEGLGSAIEILQAQTALKEAQTNYLSALYDATISKIDADKAMGLFNKN